MTAAGPPGQPPPGDLPARVFRALYPGYDLHALGRDLAGPARGHPVVHRPGHRRDRPADRRPRAPPAGPARPCPVPVTPRSAEAAR